MGPYETKRWRFPMEFPCKSPEFSILGVSGRMFLTLNEARPVGIVEPVFTLRVVLRSPQPQRVLVR